MGPSQAATPCFEEVITVDTDFDVTYVHRQQFVFGVTESFDYCPIDVGDLAVGVVNEDPVRRPFEQALKPTLATFEGGFVLIAFEFVADQLCECVDGRLLCLTDERLRGCSSAKQIVLATSSPTVIRAPT